MKYIYTLGLLLLCIHSAKSQVDSLTDDDIVSIKMAAEKSFSDYQRIMNELTDPRMLSIYRDSVIAESKDIFSPNARIEVDYDSGYLPPRLPYEVSVEKYLGDFYTYFQGETSRLRKNVYFTDRYISGVQWDAQEERYYLTILFTSLYEGLPPQKRIATLQAEEQEGGWKAVITYVKFKNISPGPDTVRAKPADSIPHSLNPLAGIAAQADSQHTENNIFLHKLSGGGRQGKEYLISWQMPEEHPVSVLLLPAEGAVIPIATSHVADRLSWTIGKDVQPGKYRIKVLDEQMMTTVVSPPFRVSSRFPLALKIGLGAVAGYYLVQTVRHDWNFAWPFGTGQDKGAEEPVPLQPELPEPPGVPD